MLRTVGRAAGLLLLAVASSPWAIPATAGAAGMRPASFNREIRPILSANCFFCHGPDKARRKAGLRLDVRESAVEEGAIVPGRPDESELWKRITTSDRDDLMPPPDSHKTLTSAQLATLRRWLAEGAPYEPHWAYVAPRRPPVPRQPDAAGSMTHPIDAFVRAALAERGLTPSPPADRRTLLRRLSLDLVGLPPTPDELRAFVDDASPRAYEKQVDRLLRSPHFGERMAVPWLDVVRFADTVGFHGDQNQNIFPYRDWVIDAFNRNQPFDRFTIDQIAGDLLPGPTTAQRVATGFLRLNIVTREGGAQPKEYLAKYMADRVRALGTAWLGSTLGCAECHDHKYDPFTTRDFYSLGAFFADIKEWGVYHDYKYTPNPELKGWSNDHPFPPEIEVDSPYLRRHATELRAAKARLTADVRDRIFADADQARRFVRWREEAREFLRRNPTGWRAATPVAVASPRAEVALEGDVTILTGKAAEGNTWITSKCSRGGVCETCG